MNTVSPWLQERLTSKPLGFTDLLPVQAVVVPEITQALMSGLQIDFMLSAPTGSGKTLCFLAPLLQWIASCKANDAETTPVLRSLILVPTKVLGAQIHDVLRILTKGTNIRSVDISNTSVSMQMQQDAVVHAAKVMSLTSEGELSAATQYRSQVDILVGTPQQVMKHVAVTAGFSLANVKVMILDEADQVLSSAFSGQINRIASSIEQEQIQKQRDAYAAFCTTSGIPCASLPPILNGGTLVKMLCSATMTSHITRIADLRLRNCRQISLASDGSERAEGEDPTLGLSTNKYTTKFAMPPGLKEHVVICQDRLRHAALLKVLYNVSGIASDEELLKPEAVEEENGSDEESSESSVADEEDEEGSDASSTSAAAPGEEVTKAKADNGDCVVLVFCEAVETVRLVSHFVRAAGFNAVEFTAYATETSRRQALASMRRGESSLLGEKRGREGVSGPLAVITTDALLRGIDLPGVKYVVMYDPPRSLPQYVHRVGRTARALRDGDSYVLLSRLGASGTITDGQVAQFKKLVDEHVQRTTPLEFEERSKYFISDDFSKMASSFLEASHSKTVEVLASKARAADSKR